MKSIQFRDNGKGVKEAAPLRSTNGLTLFNANGDVSGTATGFQIAIDTLTYIRKQVTDQKFYEVDIAKAIPLSVGEGAFSQNILTNLSFSTDGDFEAGNLNTGNSNSKLAQATSAIASKTQKVRNWAKQCSYTIFDVEQALQANNWDFIASQHKSRKKGWDLGIQKMAFVGSVTDSGNFPGLLSQANATINTTLITAPISGLSAADFATFVQTLVAAYWTNSASTVLPNRFVIPMSDWLGLTVPVSSTYPNISKLEYLKNSFAVVAPGLEIVPLAYCETANNIAAKQQYLLYRHDPETMLMTLPVDFTVTQPNSTNNFSFQDVAYGQYTGLGLFRNLEILYFRY